MVATARSTTVRTIGVATLGLLGALALPFLVHAVPHAGPVPLGARLLPIFYVGLVLVLRGHALPALAIAGLAPWVNQQVTGMPAGPMLPLLTVELVAFTGLLLVALRAVPRAAPFLGPVAYLGAAAIAGAVVASTTTSLATLGSTVAVAWPGLLALLALGALLGRRSRHERLRGVRPHADRAIVDGTANPRVPMPFERVARRLRERVSDEALGRIDAVVALARGGVVPGALAAYELGVPLRVLRMRFRDDANAPLGSAPRVVDAIPDVRGLRVLIVDDVSVSGATLRAARSALDTEAVTLVVKGAPGAADIVLFDDVPSCVVWPWFEDVAPV
jgi:uncharacterized protein